MVNPFLQSMFVQPRPVLGRALLPFSAYHAAAMLLVDSPFVSDKDAADLDDLLLATFVCQYDSVEGPKHLFPAVDPDKIVAWGEECGEFDLQLEVDAFEAYLEDYIRFPVMGGPKQSQTRTSGLPWPVYCVAFVLQHLRGISEYDAWNMPLSKLISYKSAVAEDHGWRVLSEKELALIQWGKEQPKDGEELRDGIIMSPDEAEAEAQRG